jgi:MFS family permease
MVKGRTKQDPPIPNHPELLYLSFSTSIDNNDTDAKNTDTKSVDDGGFTLYPHRWSVLASVACLSMSSAWMWITWSPIAVLVADLWDVDEGAVDALSGVYMYIYVPCSFLSLYLVVTHLGLRWGLIIGAVFNLAGAVLRYTGRNDYTTVYCGTLLAAVAQTFTLSTPPLIAGNWFGATERATATALGVLANQMGTALGLGITIVADFSSNTTTTTAHTFLIDEKKLQIYLGVQLLVSMVAFILVATFVEDQPPTPPSTATLLTRYADAAADEAEAKAELTIQSSQNGYYTYDGDAVLNEKKHLLIGVVTNTSRNNDAFPIVSKISNNNNNNNASMSYLQSISQMVSSASSMLFVLSFGLSVGVYYTIPTFLSQLLPSAWSSNWIGWLGISYQIAGIIGSFGAGRLCDITQQHRAVSLALLCGAFCSLVIFAVTARVEPSGSTWTSSLGFFLGVVGSGASLAAWNTVGMEFGTSISYPADEAAVAGVLECAAELLAFVWVTIGGSLIVVAQAEFLFVLAGAVSVSFVLLGCSRTESKRPQ